MMRFSAVFLILSLVGLSLAAVSEDEIIDLPGLDYEINFKHYSGYLDGTDGDHLHYWFTESQNDPTNDPILLWMNGGPGCSSLMGLLTELGPYRVKDDGTGVQENPYAWNLNASVLFLEAPRCVGFSYADSGSCSSGDDETSLSNYLAVQDFFKKWPEYRQNEFYISGESYAGIYVPTLSIRVLDGNNIFPLNFQGFAIGNGLLSYRQNDDSLMFYGAYHALLGQSLWDSMVEECCADGIADQENCNFEYTNNTRCDAQCTRAYNILYYGGLNIYDLYGECKHPTEKDAPRYNSRHAASMSNIFRNKRGLHEARDDPPCEDNTAARDYLNDNATRVALHIPDFVDDWDVCANIQYLRQYDDMFAQLTYLTSNGIRGIIYNGDLDMACNVIGNTWGVEYLNLPVLEGWKKWQDPDTLQVSGYRKRYENLDFVTIRGAGHMVPEDKPIVALQMITAFLDGTDY